MDMLIKLAVLRSDCLLSKFIYDAYHYAEKRISLDEIYTVHQAILEDEPLDEVVESYALDIATDKIRPKGLIDEKDGEG